LGHDPYSPAGRLATSKGRKDVNIGPCHRRMGGPGVPQESYKLRVSIYISTNTLRILPFEEQIKWRLAMAQKRILHYLQRTAYIGNVKKMEKKKNGTYINITLGGLPEF